MAAMDDEHPKPSNVQRQHASVMQKRATLPRRIWKWLDLDLNASMLIIKGTIPPLISISIYQSDAVAKEYSVAGYILGVISILGFCIMPRAKFMQTMTLNVVATCLAAATGLFKIWIGISARRNATWPDVQQGYNSSASAVVATWLFFEMYLVNSTRSARPQLQWPGIMFSVYTIIAAVYAPRFSEMQEGIHFIVLVLKVFLTGFGLATAVSLFFWPVTQRSIVFKMMSGQLEKTKQLLDAQSEYFFSLEDQDMFKVSTAASSTGQETADANESIVRRARRFKSSIASLIELNGKLHSELPHAQREIAFGKLRENDLTDFHELMRQSLLPIIGLGSVIDIFQRVAEQEGWVDFRFGDSVEMQATMEAKQRSVQEWHSIMQSMHRSYEDILQVMKASIDHVQLRLELGSRKADRATDAEAAVGSPLPGDDAFAEHMITRIEAFQASKEVTLWSWCRQKGIDIPLEDLGQHLSKLEEYELRDIDQRQIFLILYMEYLIWSTSKALYRLVIFADRKQNDGTMARKKLLVPGLDELKKWVGSLRQPERLGDELASLLGAGQQPSDELLRNALGDKKDPEHLTPVTKWQKVGNGFCLFTELLKSPHSIFGFRCAVATMSLAIIAFLKSSEQFFLDQRLIWATIMVSFSMFRTTGQSAFNFSMRVFGTFVAFIATFAIWYIVDGHTAGVIVMCWLAWIVCFYVIVKKPTFLVAGFIGSITIVLIIGYELEEAKIGLQEVMLNSQRYWPIYELAPIRFLNVAGGLAVAYFWCIFPWPISERTVLRKDLGGSLYILARYLSIVNQTIDSRLQVDVPKQAMEKIDDARGQLFSKSFLLTQRLKTYASFTKWHLTVGGAFPKDIYMDLIDRIDKLLTYSTLMEYASSSFQLPSQTEDRTRTDDSQEKRSSSQWASDFRRLAGEAGTANHEVTSLLCLLGSSLLNGQPLPPYMKPPRPYELAKKLKAIDKDILSVRHIQEEAYAAFAVVQIANRTITGDVEGLIADIKKLVGEIDFKVHGGGSDGYGKLG